MPRDVVIPPSHVDAIWGTCPNVEPAGTEHNHYVCDCPNCSSEFRMQIVTKFYRCALSQVWLPREAITETRRIGMH